VLATEALSARFRALRHHDFRLYWSGQLVSLIGTWMQSVAQAWLMHRLTSSPFMLGLLGFTQFLPVLLLALLAGVVTDRMDKRRLMLVTQTLALVQAVALAAVVTGGWVKPWMVLQLAFVFGVVNAFDLPARQSIVVELVGKEDLSNAIALNSAAFNTARILGPALAGVLVASLGEAGCFWINAVSYVAVLVSLWHIRLAERPRATGRALANMMEGLRYAARTRAIRNLLLLLGFMAGFGFQYMILLPVYARDILHTDAAGYGLLVSAFGLGSLLAAAQMTRKLERWDLRRNLLVGLGTATAGMIAFAWSRSMPLTLVMGFLAGFGLILYVASSNTLLQLTTEDRFRGRVMSLYTFFFIGTAPLGALVSGTLAQRFGAPVATTFSGVVLLFGAIWVFYRLRVLAAREGAAAKAEPPVTERLT
jgi:MFS family permease